MFATPYQDDAGRASLRQVGEARFNEDEKWIAFYDPQFALEKARLNVLKQTGELTAASSGQWTKTAQP